MVDPSMMLQTSRRGSLDVLLQAATVPTVSGPVIPDFTNVDLSSVTRSAIAYHFGQLGCPPSSSWHGRLGTIAQVQALLPGVPKKRIRRVFDAVLFAQGAGVCYTPRVSLRGRPAQLILPGSPDEQMIADLAEGRGFSYREVADELNIVRVARGDVHVGPSSVLSAMHRAGGEVSAVPKVNQGSEDETGAWCDGSLLVALWFLVRLGLRTPLEATREYRKRPTGVCAVDERFRVKSDLKMDQIAFWDETHRKCKEGCVSMLQWQFPRDTSNKVSTAFGVKKAKKLQLIRKYQEETRLSLGCHSTGGVGHRLAPFDYTLQKIVSISEWDAVLQREIIRVKKLKTKGSWESGRRDKGVFWLDDTLERVPKMTKKSILLLRGLGIITVADLLQIVDKPDPPLRGCPPQFLASLRMLCSEHLHGPVMEKIIDHRQSDNPYLSRYGDVWETKIARTTRCKPFVCITSLLHHIFKVTSLSFKGTPFAKTCYVYHDALSLMTAKATREWMKTQKIDGRSYFDMWLIPKNGLLDHLKTYVDKFIGNHPEWMCWDACLNRDVHCAVFRHCVITQHMSASDPKKFTRNTPHQQTRAYLRLLDPRLGPEGGVPSSRRICEDISRFTSALEAVVGNRGTVVHGMCPRNGHRNRGGGDHGGKYELPLHIYVLVCVRIRRTFHGTFMIGASRVSTLGACDGYIRTLKMP
jgi:hypothetical protein